MTAWQSSHGSAPPMTTNESIPASPMRNIEPARIVSASVVRADISA